MGMGKDPGPVGWGKVHRYRGKFTARYLASLLPIFKHNVSTVETRFNPVLRVHRSDPRYIQVDGNAVCPNTYVYNKSFGF